MKLHSPQFEKAVRRAAKAAIRRSPELKREARKVLPIEHIKAAPVFRVVVAMAVGFVVAAFAKSTGHPATGLATLSIWTFLSMLFRAQSLLATLYSAADIPALTLLPTPETTIFRWELQKFYRASLMSLLDLLAGFGAIGFLVDSPMVAAFIAPAAVLAWFTMLACAMLCASRFPRIPYPLILMASFFAGIVLFFGRSLFGNFTLSVLDYHAHAINVLLPTGWVPSLLLLVTGKFEWIPLLLIVPIVALLSTMPASLKLLLANYRVDEGVHPQAPDLLPEGLDEEHIDIVSSERANLPRVDSDSLEKIVRTHLFSLAPAWHERGWIENKLWQWFTPREKALSEFAFPHGVALWPAWKKIFRNLGITIVLTAAAAYSHSSLEFWVLGIGTFLCFFRALSLTLFSSVAFQSRHAGGINLPLYAGYPIGFSELSQLLVKCTACQVPLLVVFSLVTGTFFAWAMEFPFLLTLTIAFKSAGLIASLRFILLGLSFSSGTNDNVQLRLRTIVVLLSILVCGGIFLVLAAAGLLVPNPWIGWPLWALSLFASYVFFAVYRRFYDRKWFDLMTVPRQQ